MYASNPSLDRPLSMRSHVPFIIDCKRRTVDSSKEQSTIRKFEQRILTVDIRTMLTEKLRIKLRQYWRRDLHPLNITIDRSETGEGTQLEAGQNRPFLDSSSQIFVVFFAAWFNRFWDSFVLTRRRSKPLIGFQQSLFAVLLAFFSKMSNYTREYKGHKSEEVAIISCKTEGENVLKWADNSPSMCCTCTCTHRQNRLISDFLTSLTTKEQSFHLISFNGHTDRSGRLNKQRKSEVFPPFVSSFKHGFSSHCLTGVVLWLDCVFCRPTRRSSWQTIRCVFSHGTKARQ